MDSRSVVEIGQDIATILTDSSSKPADNTEPVDIDVNHVDFDDDGSSIEALAWSDFDDDELEQARLNVPSDETEVKDEDTKDSLDVVQDAEPEDDLQVSTTSTVSQVQVEKPQIPDQGQEVIATSDEIGDSSFDASVESTEEEETELLDTLKDGDKIYRFEKNQGFNEKLTFGVIITVVLAVGIGIGNFVAYTEYEDMVQVPESLKSYGSQSGMNSSSKQPLIEASQYQSLECLVTGNDAVLVQHIQLLKSCNATLGHVVEKLDSLQHRIDNLGTNKDHLWFPFSIFRPRCKILSATSPNQPRNSETVKFPAASSSPVEDFEEVTLTEAPFEDTLPEEAVLDHTSSQKSPEAVYGALAFGGAISSDEATKSNEAGSILESRLREAAASPVSSGSEVANDAQHKQSQKSRKTKPKTRKIRDESQERSKQDIKKDHADKRYDNPTKQVKKVLEKQKNFDNDLKLKNPTEKQDLKKKQKYFPANDELIQPSYKIPKNKEKSCAPPEPKRKKKTKVEKAPKPQATEFDWHIYRAKTREHRRMQNYWETEFKQQKSNWQLDRARSREMQRKQLNDAKKFKKMSNKAYYKSRD